MIKTGFVHIPRTGGTYLESLLCRELGPERFVNFFGTPENQKKNKISIIENISKDKSKQKLLKQIIDNHNVKYFSGHISLNIEQYLPKQHQYQYMTILRDPVSRVVSFVRKVTSSKTFYDYMTMGGKSNEQDFWFNYKVYVEKQLTHGLMPHERNGFNNYITKCIAGINLANPFVEVDQHIYDTALKNLDKFIYIGKFEEYKDTIDSILKICNINTNYTIRHSSARPVPDSVLEFIYDKNIYDRKLYDRIFK